VKLHPLLVARLLSPPGMFHRQPGRMAWRKALGIGVPREEWTETPVVAFLVEHPSVGPILIDTGFHPSVAVEPKGAMGRFGGLLFKDVRMDSRQAVPDQLRERGIEPGDVKVVVMTHLHSDHASGVGVFPDPTFVVSKQEWEAASNGSELRGYIKRQFDHAFDWRTVDFDAPGIDSFATFGRGVDLFGDGSVRMVFTPGHTAGHCAVILRLRDREALIAGDAIYTMRTLRESALPYLMDDEHRFRRSLKEIQLYAKETPDALIVPGHDIEHWRTLAPVYD
jgi:glyoxylase-like metal-dependent hydrolase (beta-lactamase superfamily II)